MLEELTLEELEGAERVFKGECNLRLEQVEWVRQYPGIKGKGYAFDYITWALQLKTVQDEIARRNV
jgi:hypothetical protein